MKNKILIVALLLSTLGRVEAIEVPNWPVFLENISNDSLIISSTSKDSQKAIPFLTQTRFVKPVTEENSEFLSFLQLPSATETVTEDVSAKCDYGAAVTPSSIVAGQYSYVFEARFNACNWTGDVVMWSIDSNGRMYGKIDSDGNSVVDENNKPEPLFSASEKLWDMYRDHPNKRNIIYAADSGATTKFSASMVNAEKGAMFDALNKNRPSVAESLDEKSYVAKLINWVRGSASNEIGQSEALFRARGGDENENTNIGPSILGDIVASNITYVASPRSYGFLGKSAGYKQFAKDHQDRTQALYVGANDGMLHAFNAKTGEELFGFVPKTTADKIGYVAAEKYACSNKKNTSCHTGLVNGATIVSDYQKSNGDWGTVLVGSLGTGGRGVFALDVTDPSDPKVIWDISNNTGNTDVFKDLYYTMGTARVAKLDDGNWYAVVANGYDDSSDGVELGKAALYLIPLNKIEQTQKDVAKKTIKLVAYDDSSNRLKDNDGADVGNGLSSPMITAFYSDVENTIDQSVVNYAYAGDLYGNLYKFDLTKLSRHRNSDAVSSHVTLLLNTNEDRVNNTELSTDNYFESITTWPILKYFSKRTEDEITLGLMVYVGTGKHIEYSDNGTNQKNAMYAIFDDPQNSKSSIHLADLSERKLVSEVCDSMIANSQEGTPPVCAESGEGTDVEYDNIYTFLNDETLAADNQGRWWLDSTPKFGWEMDLGTDERVISAPLLSGGLIVFNGVVPSELTGGRTYAYALDWRTGSAPLNNTTFVRSGRTQENLASADDGTPAVRRKVSDSVITDTNQINTGEMNKIIGASTDGLLSDISIKTNEIGTRQLTPGLKPSPTPSNPTTEANCTETSTGYCLPVIGGARGRASWLEIHRD